jgi:hypothetical protein
VDWGRADLTTYGWAGNNGAGIGETTLRPFYAMSGLLTVSAAVVPVPAALPLMIGALGAFGFIARRKARG